MPSARTGQLTKPHMRVLGTIAHHGNADVEDVANRLDYDDPAARVRDGSDHAGRRRGLPRHDLPGALTNQGAAIWYVPGTSKIAAPQDSSLST